MSADYWWHVGILQGFVWHSSCFLRAQACQITCYGSVSCCENEQSRGIDQLSQEFAEKFRIFLGIRKFLELKTSIWLLQSSRMSATTCQILAVLAARQERCV